MPRRVPLLFAASLALLLPGALAAGTVLDEVSGNWAGASGQGFAFRAVLSDEGGQARLQIWQGMDAAGLTALL